MISTATQCLPGKLSDLSAIPGGGKKEEGLKGGEENGEKEAARYIRYRCQFPMMNVINMLSKTCQLKILNLKKNRTGPNYTIMQLCSCVR